MAVYDVEDFFIGKVTKVISEEEATVNFLEKVGSKDGVVVYRWPRSEDCTEISSAVVFAKRICNLHLHHRQDAVSYTHLTLPTNHRV